MIINLSPVRKDSHLILVVKGDSLIVNGEAFDFSLLQEGDTLPREAITSPWFVSDVCRVEGVLRMTLVLPHGPEASEAARYPEAIVITKDGPVELPQ